MTQSIRVAERTYEVRESFNMGGVEVYCIWEVRINDYGGAEPEVSAELTLCPTADTPIEARRQGSTRTVPSSEIPGSILSEIEDAMVEDRRWIEDVLDPSVETE